MVDTVAKGDGDKVFDKSVDRVAWFVVGISVEGDS